MASTANEKGTDAEKQPILHDYPAEQAEMKRIRWDKRRKQTEERSAVK
jgi:hypothetical protein